jgi:aryl-alcohol dehydrogenase-like predicted oxidoreductase
VPIPGTTKRHCLEENVGAAAVELTADDLRELDDLLAKQPVQGDRYNAQMMKTVNR